MAIKLKTKIALGGIFLFALLLMVGAVCFYYFNRITEEAKGIIRDNYETLNYSRDMLKEMDELAGKDSLASLASFEHNLQAQEKNITEAGEKELTDSLRKNFNAIKQKRSPDSARSLMRRNISGIMQLNLRAIDKKNTAAKISAEKAKMIITVILTICTLIGLTFLYNFPSLVASPVARLTDAIKAITKKNYRQRIHLNRHDEFGQLADAFNSMAEKLDEYEHSNLSKILFEKKRAETVINSLKDASIGIDNNGAILFANKRALQLLNLKETEIVGQLQQSVETKNDLFRFLVKENHNVPFKIVVEGKENYFTKESIDISQGDEQPGTVIVLKNITSFKELDVAKTNFIATVSHELKTPLASSDFSLKLLEDERVGKLSDEQKDLLNSLKLDNQRMLRILSELLNMAQVESGKIQLDIREANPYNIVRTSISTVSAAAKEKQIAIDLNLENDLPAIKTDPDKLGWVLNNFLTNAIRYSPEQSEVVVAVNKKAGSVSFSVSDTGPGIDDAYIDKIFDRYFQVPVHMSKKGTGIGLAICKEFIEALSGAIWVKSKIGEGSVFGFDIPVT